MTGAVAFSPMKSPRGAGTVDPPERCFMMHEGYSLFHCEVKSCATRLCPTPPGPEGSNGRQSVLCDAGELDLFLFAGSWPVTNVPGLIRGPAPAGCTFTELSMLRTAVRLLTIIRATRLMRRGAACHAGRRAHVFGRPGMTRPQVYSHRGNPLASYGTVPRRIEPLHALTAHHRPKWKRFSYEKRYHHQLHGERTPYRHS